MARLASAMLHTPSLELGSTNTILMCVSEFLTLKRVTPVHHEYLKYQDDNFLMARKFESIKK
jgi:hypothetical protein